MYSSMYFHRQTETCYGDQAICRARILMRRCSMMLPVVRMLMGIAVLVMEIWFMMVELVLFFSL